MFRFYAIFLGLFCKNTNLHALCSLLLAHTVNARAHCLVLPFKVKALMQDMGSPQYALAQ